MTYLRPTQPTGCNDQPPLMHANDLKVDEWLLHTFLCPITLGFRDKATAISLARRGKHREKKAERMIKT